MVRLRKLQPGGAGTLDSVAFRASSVPMLVAGPDARIRSVNHAFTRVTGYTADEVRGRNPRLLQSGLHDARFYDEMWGALERDGRWQGEIWNRRKGGELFAEWLTLDAVRDDSGRVTHYVGVFSDITRHKRLEERLRELAYFDPLSGLPNRALLADRAERALRAAWRGGTCVGLLFIDLDDFKAINDAWGHEIGDRALQLLGCCFRMHLRKSDTVARVGGDEFVALLPEIHGPANAARVAQSILDSLRDGIVVDGHGLEVGASIGISTFPHDGSEVDTLLRVADRALYAAKRAGKHRYRLHGEAGPRTTPRRTRELRP